MDAPRLTPTSYVVLGLIEFLEPATPYDLKLVSAQGVTNFWSLPHTQLYAECGRLADLGLLDEERETTGRRRRIFRLSAAGRDELSAWREDTSPTHYELRDAGILKLFFGAEPSKLAASQIEAHKDRLAAYEALASVDMAPGMRLALEGGIGHEREYIRFWESLAEAAEQPD